MRRLSIQWGWVVVAMVVCAGVGKGQTTSLVTVMGPGPVTVDVGASPTLPFSATDSDPNILNVCCSWSASGLPSGMTITPALIPTSAQITGTPPVGTFSITVTATDTDMNFGSNTVTLTVNAAPTISPGSLPAGVDGTAYSPVTLSVTNGTPPYSAITLSGTLPTGMMYNTSTGVLSGMPSQAGAFPLTATATDSLNVTASQNYTLQIANPPPLAVGTTSLPSGAAGTNYVGTTLTATGGVPPYTWSVPP